MRALSDAIDRFCRKHPRFGIPRLMFFIVAGNAAVLILSMMDTTGAFVFYLQLNPALILQGQVWRLVTFVFTSAAASDNLFFAAITLYFYYFIGNALESEWGTGKFTFYYLSGMVLTLIYGIILWILTRSFFLISVGPDYINLAMFFAFAVFFPDATFLLFFIIPVKAKWLAWVDAAFFAFAVITGPFPINLVPLVALLNFFIFCGPDLADALRGSANRFKQSNSKRSRDFKREAQQARQQNRARGFTHRCEVCGRTDSDSPHLEFRYCSRCQGYHCYCIEHINAHVHK